MKFVKGVVVGSLISAGVMYYCTEVNKCGTRKLMKQGKRWIKNMGIM